MSELDDALARLERAVARLEAASAAAGAHGAMDQQVADVVAAIVGHIDAALARLGQLLDREA